MFGIKLAEFQRILDVSVTGDTDRFWTYCSESDSSKCIRLPKELTTQDELLSVLEDLEKEYQATKVRIKAIKQKENLASIVDEFNNFKH